MVNGVLNMKHNYVNVKFTAPGTWSDLPSEPIFDVEDGDIVSVTADMAKVVVAAKKGVITDAEATKTKLGAAVLPAEPAEPVSDADGFDADGYNKEGFNREGFNREGFNADGFDADGFDADGFDVEGYDSKGFNADGLDREGNKSPSLMDKLTGKGKSNDKPPVKDKKKSESK